MNDPVIESLIRQATADPNTLGLALLGSHGVGIADDVSDYDPLWVFTDAAYDEPSMRHEPEPVISATDGRNLLDMWYTSPRELARIAREPGWWTPGFIGASVLVDKTGEVAGLLEAIIAVSPEKSRADVAAWFDAYLNAFYRSLKAWLRGNLLGARLQAADSATYLVRTLFALEGRLTPYWDRLDRYLDALAEQGWQSAQLRQTILDLLTTGDPRLQIDLEERVEALLRSRGFGKVVDDWGGELERVKARALS